MPFIRQLVNSVYGSAFRPETVCPKCPAMVAAIYSSVSTACNPHKQTGDSVSPSHNRSSYKQGGRVIHSFVLALRPPDSYDPVLSAYSSCCVHSNNVI